MSLDLREFSRQVRSAMVLAPAAVVLAALLVGGPTGKGSIATAEDTTRKLPAPPASGELGFVVSNFSPMIIPGLDACPGGVVPRLRDAYLLTLPAADRERLKRPENAKEYDQLWRAYAFGVNGANICTNPDMFERPLMSTVKARQAWGLDLDGGRGADACAHEEFTSPQGERGIDNQEYRVMGCTPEWRGVDGTGGDQLRGSRQFHQSGEWTQVLLIRGVDSLVRDDQVEVIYANVADRPLLNSAGEFLRGASYSISDAPPRHRNVLRGRIVGGVLTTEPADIKLTQTWGQGGARDIRGVRTTFDYRRGRLKLTFQPDGSVAGMLGGYKPVFDVINAPALGGAGSATVAGIDCAQQLSTLRKMADGIRDPKTGKCTAVSSAVKVEGVPAFVNDVRTRMTAR